MEWGGGSEGKGMRVGERERERKRIGNQIATCSHSAFIQLFHILLKLLLLATTTKTYC